MYGLTESVVRLHQVASVRGATSEAVLQFDGTNLNVSLAGAAPVTLLTSSITVPITITTSTLPAFTVDFGGAQNGTIARIYASTGVTQNEKITGLLIDLQSQVTPGSNAQTGISILVDNTSAAAATAASAIYVDSNATLQRVVDIDAANTQGVVMYLHSGAAQTLNGTLRAMYIDFFSGSVAGGNAAFIGIEIISPTNVSNQSTGVLVDGRGFTNGTAFGPNGHSLNRVYFGDTTTLTAGGTRPICGFQFDGTNLAPNNNAVLGLNLIIPATTRANTAGEGALVIDSNATLARTLDIDAANTGGNIAVITASAGLSTSLIGWYVNFSGSTGAVQQQCYSGTTSAQSAATSIVFLGTCNATAGASLGVALIQGTQTLTNGGSAPLLGYVADFSGVTPNNNAVIGAKLQIPATTRANTAGEGALVVASLATSARALTVGVANKADTIGIIHYTSDPGALTGAVSGWIVDLQTSVGTPGSNVLRPLYILTAATTAANVAGAAAFLIDSNATLQRAIDIDIANTACETGSVTIRYGTSTQLAGNLVGFETNFVTNVDGNGKGIFCFVGRTAAAASAATCCFYADMRTTGGTTTGMFRAGADVSTTLTGPCVAFHAELVGQIANTNQQTTGLLCQQRYASTSTQRVIHGLSENGATWTFGCWSENLTLSTSGATTDTTNQIPANSFILGIDYYITTTIAGVNSTGYSIGDATTAARFGTGTTLTSGTSGVLITHLSGASVTLATGPSTSTAISVRFTLTGGADNTPSAGAVRITVRYITFGAATS